MWYPQHIQIHSKTTPSQFQTKYILLLFHGAIFDLELPPAGFALPSRTSTQLVTMELQRMVAPVRSWNRGRPRPRRMHPWICSRPYRMQLEI